MAPRDIRLGGRPVPVPAPGEALVRIRAVGICGSDLHYAHGRIGDVRSAPGHILGHEVSGVVEALGPGTAGPVPGTPVAVDPAIHCGTCRFCAEGHPNLCRDLRFFGSPPTPGALREYLTHPAHLLHPLPPALTFPVGATIEPLGVAIHAVDLGTSPSARRWPSSAAGPVGLMIAGVAQLAGARLVCAAEPLPHRRKIAAQFGVGGRVRSRGRRRGARHQGSDGRRRRGRGLRGRRKPERHGAGRAGPCGRAGPSCWSDTGRRTRSRCPGSRPCARGSPSASSADEAHVPPGHRPGPPGPGEPVGLVTHEFPSTRWPRPSSARTDGPRHRQGGGAPVTGRPPDSPARR